MTICANICADEQCLLNLIHRGPEVKFHQAPQEFKSKQLASQLPHWKIPPGEIIAEDESHTFWIAAYLQGIGLNVVYVFRSLRV